MNHPLHPLVEKTPEQRDAGEHCSVTSGSADFETQRRTGHPIEYRARGMSHWQPCAVLPHMPLDKTGHWEFRLKPNTQAQTRAEDQL
jgi:hypothetical protein